MQIKYEWPGPLIPGIFQVRLNRFVAEVLIDNQVQVVHVTNSGRMRELLVSGNQVWCLKHADESRKTAYSLVLAEAGGSIVCLDSRIPNILVGRGLKGGYFPWLGSLETVKPECKYGASRFDFYVCGSDRKGYIETKSVTLVENGQARFPDAPTERGVKHLKELIEVKQEGMFAGVVFIIQREDGLSFAPNDQTHFEFGTALREAAASGVLVKAISCQVTLEGISLAKEVQIEL